MSDRGEIVVRATATELIGMARDFLDAAILGEVEGQLLNEDGVQSMRIERVEDDGD